MPPSIKIILYFGVILLLTSCGELPKPFSQPPTLKKNPLITYSGGGAIKVEVDPTLPASLSEPLIENMVESLWKENVPASTAPGFKPRYSLKGQLKILSSSLFEAEKVELVWTLFGENEKKKHRFTYKLFGERPGWLLLDEGPLDSLRQDMGKDVVKYLYRKQGSDGHELNLHSNIEQTVSRNRLKLPRNLIISSPNKLNDSQISLKTPKIFLNKIVGAPGGGNNSLQKHIRRNLIIAGINVIEDRQRSMFLLNGFVNISPTYGELNDIAITWLVTTKDGRIVGKATQNNRVPKIIISREWGQVAENAAREGTAGIMNIIGKYLTSIMSVD